MTHTIWIMVLMLSGQGRAAIVLPFYYPSAEACKQAYDAAAEAKEYGEEPGYFCVPGPTP